MEADMPGLKQRLLSATAALCLALSFASEAYAFGHGGGGHFGGGHSGHFGGHGGRHFAGHHYGGHHYAGHSGHGHFAHAHGHQHFAHGVGHGVAAGHGFGHGAWAGHGGWGGHSGYWHNQYGYGGWGWGGGSVFWPYYYGDALSFALWPDYYDDSFFDYGPDALFAGLYWPGYDDSGYGAYSGGYGSGNLYAGAPPSRHRRHHQQTQQPQAQANASDACATQAPDVTSLPIDRIAKAIQPSTDQTSLLNDLKDAETKAGDILHAACPSQVPLTPVARFDAIEQRLTATQQAIDLIRTPLARLYDSLGDAQKAKFDAVALGHRARPTKAKEPPADVAALCKQRSQQFTGLPAQQIADTLKPTPDQKSAFDALKTAADEASATVAAACPNTAPQNVAERFDAIDARLKATIAAIKQVDPKLKAFYATLTDEQKAQFNLLSPPANTTPDTTSRG
ncbi:hypothetical protein CWB41_04025 [Methylovirgula ligni]|nr:hypothetical protein CWB41_04025 [Methylovirgula ligni]